MAYKKSSAALALAYLRENGGKSEKKQVIDYVLTRKSFLGKTPRNTISSTIQRCPQIGSDSKSFFILK